MTLEAQIKSVLPKYLYNFFTLVLLKNSFIVGILFCRETSATLLEGSIPSTSYLLFLKFLRKVPSFDPISIILELSIKYLSTNLA